MQTMEQAVCEYGCRDIKVSASSRNKGPKQAARRFRGCIMQEGTTPPFPRDVGHDARVRVRSLGSQAPHAREGNNGGEGEAVIGEDNPRMEKSYHMQP